MLNISGLASMRGVRADSCWTNISSFLIEFELIKMFVENKKKKFIKPYRCKANSVVNSVEGK
jgi:hypothetical protein